MRENLHQEPEAVPGSIAFIAATPDESSCLLPLLRDPTSLPAPRGMELRRGSLGSSHVLVLTCGVGKVPAAAGSMYLLERHRARVLVLIGTAGSLDPRLRLGDLVVADEVLPADVGVIHSGGFGHTGPGLCEGGKVLFYPSFPAGGELAEMAGRSAARTALTCHRGRIITCDQVVLDPELRAHLGSTFRALAVEMEGSAVVQVAAGAGVPAAVIKAVSDEMEHDFVGLEDLLPYSGQSRPDLWSKRFRMMAADGSLLARARDMRRGMRRALASLRRFLEAFLPALS
ncbi:5'-methylthioadenosine/S-adenosylhomocysteine nucleosidase [Candidatus Solincola sp.]|nr:5'-methylthioadenosine/S-adenosylhomocysteine nucleosidase [Actinomycetota bacterium]MDI7252596.1 5'-methylthioadenosine/S-adenosylhomocysteine nucleosidase [Actinomycetota bacterium]